MGAMGIRIFRDGNWNMIQYISASLRDFSGLDLHKDRELIDYLILHASEKSQDRLMRKYGLSDLPVKRINIDDVNDDIYPAYYVFREQVIRETDREALREVAFSDEGSAGKFAFCRLTGYSWPPDECDAYSYRTYACGLMRDMTRADIEALCRDMIERNGPFAREAEKWITRLPEISDEQLDEWAADE